MQSQIINLKIQTVKLLNSNSPTHTNTISQYYICQPVLSQTTYDMYGIL